MIVLLNILLFLRNKKWIKMEVLTYKKGDCEI